ncbi:MAG: helix-turn-helix domain-containing protein [Pseudomonadota bacterium]
MSSQLDPQDPFVVGVAQAVARLLRENPPLPREWFTVAEVSVYLNKPENTIREMIRDAGLPAHKLGRQWRVHKAELDAWIIGDESAA